MRLLSRLTPGSPASGGATAVHARVADGEHLWLAVRGAETLVLRRSGGPDLDVPAEPDPADPDLLTAVFPLAAALAAEDGDVELRLGHGRRGAPVAADLEPRPPSPTLEAPTTRDGRAQLSVEVVEGEVVVRRRVLPPTVPVLALAVDGDAVRVTLGCGSGTASVGSDEVAVVDGVLRLGDLPGLHDRAAGEPSPVLVSGVPAVRSRSVLARPFVSVALPPMPGAGVELRWLRDGRLAVVRLQREDAG